ncbi:MAG: hypothetical protein AABY22_22705 [Nanoarchaeota archaeon]
MKKEKPKENSPLEISKNSIEYLDYFRFHNFLSFCKIKNIPYKEWMGETKNDEIVIINYREGIVIIGAGYNEIKARQNMRALCETRDMLGLLRHDDNVNIHKIDNMLKLEWVLPEGYIDE